MATPTTMTDLSTTIASNSPAGSESPTNGDDFLRAIQGILRRTNAKGSDIASATTTDIGAATAEFVDVTGTTTITGLGTIDAGISRVVRFTGALTLTYNATSLILPGNANITTANGDVAFFRSLGSGNWLCTNYVKEDGTAVIAPYLLLAGGTMTGDITMSASMLKFAKGADVASATALPLITDGNYFDVTGTTTITSFNSVGVGTLVGLHFDGALTLTHNATDLILPGGANITTSAGDEALFIEYASGDYRCISYTKANGRAIVSAPVLGSPVATTSGTSVNVATSIPSTATEIKLSLNNVSINATDNIIIRLNGVSSGYGSSSQQATAAAVATVAETTAFRVTTNSPIGGTAVSGHATFVLHDATNFIYTYSIMTGNSAAATMYYAAGTVTLSGLLTTIAITSSAASTFDGGSVTTIIY